MRRLGSLVMRAAEASRVPAGAALAVDRERFADIVTQTLNDHPLITVVREEVLSIPASSDAEPVIVATGPLTSDALSADLAAVVGQGHLYFYDAISPIVLAETIDLSKVFRQSRWGRSLRSSDVALALHAPQPACGVDDGQGDYLNCPLTRDDYERFYEALTTAESATVHDFDKERFFEGCLPIEVMAHRGATRCVSGRWSPVGLVDPRTGRVSRTAGSCGRIIAGEHFSLVGFQTQIKWGDRARAAAFLGERAEFVRFMVHRNTYINGPAVLADTWQVRSRPSLFFAGQMSGVEGYVESAASGLVAGLNAAAMAGGEAVSAPPRTTAIGALSYYVSHANPAHYEPSNITFGIMQPLQKAPKGKKLRNEALSARALADLQQWVNGRTSQSVSPVSLA